MYELFFIHVETRLVVSDGFDALQIKYINAPVQQDC